MVDHHSLDPRLLDAARQGDLDARRALVADARRRNDDALEVELLASLPGSGAFDRLATLVDRGHGDLDHLGELLDTEWPPASRVLATTRLVGWLERRRPAPRCLPLVRGITGRLDAPCIDALAHSDVVAHLERLELTLELTDPEPVRRARDEWLQDSRQRLGDSPSPQEARGWFDNAHHDAVGDSVERNEARLEAVARLLTRTRLRAFALHVDATTLLCEPMADVGRALATNPLDELELRGMASVLATCLSHLRATSSTPRALQRLVLGLTTNLGAEPGAGFADLAAWLRTMLVPGCLRTLDIELTDLDDRRPARPELDTALVELVARHPWLQSLRACGLGIDDATGAGLVDGLGPAHLREVVLDDNALTAWRTVAGLVSHPRLERLSLRGNAIGDFEVVSVARMGSSALQTIDLRDNPLPVDVCDDIRAASARAGQDADGPELEVGSRVAHTTFGHGTVRALDGNKIVVGFDSHGEKKLLARFLTAARASLAEPLRCEVLVGGAPRPGGALSGTQT